MEPRLPALDPSQASDAQRAVLNAILTGPRGNLDGPFLSWIHSPELARRAQELGAFCRYDSGLPLRLSEFAILCTAARWRSQAEWHIHYPIGVKAGLSVDMLETIRTGKSPEISDAYEALVWRLVSELYDLKRITEATYQDAIARFGTEVLVNLIGLLGYYALVAMTLNVFHVSAQGQRELPFEPEGL
ncbi:carboxymuconolactone decarboxylase family protein [Pandoraea fibrosis]|uniref:4-carboxymuconolactone decarboxylase n=1 Tax=Pandoraea fibrosis TaxID=1891094 RepID=A0A5E4XNR8_9BURK|nr:carboxymuconolactone decarboxylase family protein [Pandoraea fibrosis]VVE38017.1 4-carboxymuconolactone decarboxylase [Pandoraea fibrosis]